MLNICLIFGVNVIIFIVMNDSNDILVVGGVVGVDSWVLFVDLVLIEW